MDIMDYERSSETGRSGGDGLPCVPVDGTTNRELFEMYVYRRLAQYGHIPSMYVAEDYEVLNKVRRNPDAYVAFSAVRCVVRMKYALMHGEKFGRKSEYTDAQLSELEGYVDMLFPEVSGGGD